MYLLTIVMENAILSQRGKPIFVENGMSNTFEKNSKNGDTQPTIFKFIKGLARS